MNSFQRIAKKGGAFATGAIVKLTMLRHWVRQPLLFSYAFMPLIYSPVSAKTSLNLRTPSTKR